MILPWRSIVAIGVLVASMACAAEDRHLYFRVQDSTGAAVEGAVVELLSDETPGAVPPTKIMDQVDKTFQPGVLPVIQHQTVAFPNSDNIRHHVYSFSPAKQFELKLYADTPGQPVRFDRPGVVVLGCNIHDSMVGYVYVSHSAYSDKTDSGGEVSLPPPADLDGVVLWHPALSPNALETLRLGPEDAMANGEGTREDPWRVSLPINLEAITHRQRERPVDKFERFAD